MTSLRNSWGIHGRPSTCHVLSSFSSASVPGPDDENHSPPAQVLVLYIQSKPGSQIPVMDTRVSRRSHPTAWLCLADTNTQPANKCNPYPIIQLCPSHTVTPCPKTQSYLLRASTKAPIAPTAIPTELRMATPISPSLATLSSTRARRLVACRFAGSRSSRRSL